jgi:ketosteroid isomerase-like protein
MDVRELAADYAAMVKNGQMDEAAMKYWSDDIVTEEAMEGGPYAAVTRGKTEAVAKAEAWYANTEVHAMTADGPYVHGDIFLLRIDLDATPKGGERMRMTEVVEYQVRDGKVVRERYFY